MNTFTQWMIGVALAGVVLVAGAGGGYLLARGHYEPLLADANQQIGTLRHANEALAASVKTQNEAVADLEKQARQRAADAAKALAAARSQSARDQARAQAVLAEAKPVELNDCEAAQAAFAAELRGERGAP